MNAVLPTEAVSILIIFSLPLFLLFFAFYFSLFILFIYFISFSSITQDSAISETRFPSCAHQQLRMLWQVFQNRSRVFAASVKFTKRVQISLDPQRVVSHIVRKSPVAYPTFLCFFCLVFVLWSILPPTISSSVTV